MNKSIALVNCSLQKLLISIDGAEPSENSISLLLFILVLLRFKKWTHLAIQIIEVLESSNISISLISQYSIFLSRL